jgi:hypothetical protein
MLREQKGRVSKRKRTSRATSKLTANLTDNASFSITESLQEEVHPTRLKQEPMPAPFVILSHIPKTSNSLSPPASTKREPSDSDTDQNSPGSYHHPFLLKVKFLLNGKPILLTQEILPINLIQQEHTLEFISLELFSGNKQPIPLIPALSKSSNDTPQEKQDSISPITTLNPTTSPKTGIPIAHLLNSTTSTNSSSSLPQDPSPLQSPTRQIHMHYTDNEMSPEEKWHRCRGMHIRILLSQLLLPRFKKSERKHQHQHQHQ